MYLAQAPTPPEPNRPNTEINRIEVGTRQDGTQYSRVVEVPVTSENFGWQTVAEGLSTGSWAVLLFIGVVAWKYSGSVGKFVDKQMELLSTMKNTLQNHSESFAKTAESEKAQAALLLTISATEAKLLEKVESLQRAKLKQTKAVLAAIEELKMLHEDSHVALSTIDSQYRKPRKSLAAPIDLEEDEE